MDTTIPATVLYYNDICESTFKDTPKHKNKMYSGPGLILQQEGLLNDTVSLVNKLRNSKDLYVRDKIDLNLYCGFELGWSLLTHFDSLVSRTKSNSVTFNSNRPVSLKDLYEVGDKEVPFLIGISIENVIQS